MSANNNEANGHTAEVESILSQSFHDDKQAEETYDSLVRSGQIHSPTPYRICGASKGHCKCHMIWSEPDDCVIAVCVTGDDRNYTEGEGVTHEQAVTNGHYIVHACNNYPTLLAQRDALLKAAKEALEAAESWIHDQLDGTTSLDRALEELSSVRSAIADCEKGE